MWPNKVCLLTRPECPLATSDPAQQRPKKRMTINLQASLNPMLVPYILFLEHLFTLLVILGSLPFIPALPPKHSQMDKYLEENISTHQAAAI